MLTHPLPSMTVRARGDSFSGGREYGGRESYEQGLGEYGDMTSSFTSSR